MNASQKYRPSENNYLYNGKELQNESLDGVSLGLYDYGKRFYDPMIARWTTQDPAIEDDHYEHSPYIYVYNNPVKLIDPFGLDSLQRAQALEMSQKIVDANPRKDPKLYDPSGNGEIGEKGKKPGEAMDCSGMGSNWRVAGNEQDLVGTIKGINAAESRFGKGETNGVKQHAATSETVELRNIVPGNEVYFNNYGHIGLVTKVNTDNSGNPISIEFQHSGSSTGPTTASANLDGSGYWGSRIDSFGKWDTKPDNTNTYQNTNRAWSQIPFYTFTK